MSGCPNSTEGGCRCPEHHPGLAETASDPAGYDAALARLRPATTLRVVTMPVRTERPCTGGMTCSCERCLRQRADAINRGPVGSGARQPWEARPSRRAA